MDPVIYPRSLRHFVKHVLVISKNYREREAVKEDIFNQLHKMRRSIIKMNLTYSEVDRLKEKIEKFMAIEAKYAKFFKSEDEETKELKVHIGMLEEELKKEREEKMRILNDQDERVKELTESLENIKNRMKHLMMEKAKRQVRMKALEGKINEKIDTRDYYKS